MTDLLFVLSAIGFVVYVLVWFFVDPYGRKDR